MDTIVIPLSLWTPAGLTRLESIEWLPLVLQPLLPIPLSQKLEQEDSLRICEVESLANWAVAESSTIYQLINKSHLMKYFNLEGLYSSGCDIVYVKAVLSAAKEGSSI